MVMCMHRECKKCDDALQATDDRAAELQARVTALRMKSVQLGQEARMWFQVAAHSVAAARQTQSLLSF